ncbi:transcription factor E2F/dimerization partner [Ostertagia ostertagi]
MGDAGQKFDHGQGHVVIKQEKVDYRSPAPARRHGQQSNKLKYPDVRMASCFRPSGLLASDLPVDNKHYVDKSMGLRHFSTKVCEKVKEKGRTNYNQVADELVAEYFAANNMNSEEFLERQKFDQKNIRRRVYDALNVLLAMNIICKRKKDIDWVGLPATKAGEIKRLEEEKAKLTERIRRKKETIQELIVQLVAYKSLVWKNREMERVSARPPENTILYLPFVIINTSKNTTVDCAVSGDRSEFLFNFDQSFEVHDDFEVRRCFAFGYYTCIDKVVSHYSAVKLT